MSIFVRLAGSIGACIFALGVVHGGLTLVGVWGSHWPLFSRELHDTHEVQMSTMKTIARTCNGASTPAEMGAI